MPCGEGNSDHDLLETSVLLFGGIALVCTCFCMDLWQQCGQEPVWTSRGLKLTLHHSAKEI